MFVFFWILASMGVAYAAKLNHAPTLLVVRDLDRPHAAGWKRGALGGEPLEYQVLPPDMSAA